MSLRFFKSSEDVQQDRVLDYFIWLRNVKDIKSEDVRQDRVLDYFIWLRNVQDIKS
jgi:hypothetical protein